jgi:uncharacterized protein (DUF4415 family)
MTESKEDTDPDWLDPDVDPDEAPELTDEVFDRAQFAIGGKVIRPATGTLTRAFTPEELRVRRGRPPLGETAKVQQSLRLSREVLEHFRATGPGWQARIDEVLKRHVREEEEWALGRAADAEGAKARVAEEREAWRGEGEEGEG